MAQQMKKVKIFDDLKLALDEALMYERGQRVDLRTTTIPPAPKRISPRQIREIRRSFNASQLLFARLLNVSPNAVRSWEQGVRRPQNPVLRLLDVARRDPQALLRAG
jgi:DNA-binding transcriptional regulator YiaG